MPRYEVLTASDRVPGSCIGRYARVAVVEIEDGFSGRPAMISERARGVKRIVQVWNRRNVGKTQRGAFQRAKAEAEQLAARLNDD